MPSGRSPHFACAGKDWSTSTMADLRAAREMDPSAGKMIEAVPVEVEHAA
jgi:hypothetical protein